MAVECLFSIFFKGSYFAGKCSFGGSIDKLVGKKLRRNVKETGHAWNNIDKKTYYQCATLGSTSMFAVGYKKPIKEARVKAMSCGWICTVNINPN